MTYDEIPKLPDDAKILINGAALKRLLHFATMLRAGLSPKNEMAMMYGTDLYKIVHAAKEIK